MNEKTLKKFMAIQRKLAKEKGAFKLFALIQLEEVPGRWDVVMSCQNLPEKDMPTLRYVVEKIHAGLTTQEIVQLSRIILLNVEQPFVKAMEQFLERTNNSKEIFNCEIDELMIKKAYIIVSPVKKEKATVNISAKTLNDLINRIQKLESATASG
ncbi:conserved hypothetical protein [Beggiatoa sp. PS]|nr:conserved hypothetical protein [Beggiatoa sp. PS]